MKVFLTGGSGFVGSHIIPELLARGHSVVALVRSDASAEKIKAQDSSIETVKGDLKDVDVLKSTASRSDIDAVIHVGFIHDFANMAESVKVDYAAIQAFGESFKGTNKAIVAAFASLIGKPGQVVTEEDGFAPDSLGEYRRPSDDLLKQLAKEGIRTSSVRLAPTVHGHNDWAFIPFAIAQAKKNNVSPYVLRSDGSDLAVRWNAVHVKDAARLFVLAAEKGEAGANYHGVGDQEVSWKDIAEVVGKKLDIGTKSVTAGEAGSHFEWLTPFVSHDQPVSNKITREKLGWEPKEVSLLEDLESGDYFARYQ